MSSQRIDSALGRFFGLAAVVAAIALAMPGLQVTRVAAEPGQALEDVAATAVSADPLLVQETALPAIGNLAEPGDLAQPAIRVQPQEPPGFLGDQNLAGGQKSKPPRRREPLRLFFDAQRALRALKRLYGQRPERQTGKYHWKSGHGSSPFGGQE